MLKDVIKEYIPPALQPALGRLANKMKFHLSGVSELLAKNSELKGIAKGKTAFLCATGPSIKVQNLEKLIGRDVFSISNFFLHPLIPKIRPMMQFFAPYHEPLILSNYIEWLAKSDQLLPDETAIVLGHKTKELVDKYSLFSSRKVYYLYLSNHPCPSLVDLVKPVLAPQTGPIMILPVLIYMGYSKIALIGCDHTVLRYYKKDIEHFYTKRLDIRKNASDKNAWDSIIDSHIHSLNVFKQYNFYKKHLEHQIVTTTNLSHDSWLDIFPVEDFDRFFDAEDQQKSS